MDARGWTARDVALQIGGTIKDVAVWELTVDLLIHCSERDDLIVGDETATALGNAFGTSPEYWLNLNTAYKQWRRHAGGTPNE
jgi:plasmid maintenance system antidote protein VapI